MILAIHSKKPNILVTGSRDGTMVMWIEEGRELNLKKKFILNRDAIRTLGRFEE